MIAIPGSTIAVTGATGFIGRRLVARLRGRGAAVRALVRQESMQRLDLTNGMEIVPGDVTDPNAVHNLMRDATVVIHLAARRGGLAPMATRSSAAPGFSDSMTPEAMNPYERANVLGTRTVLEAARSAGIERVVYTSTCVALGPSSGTPRDEACLPPDAHFVNEYQRTKILADRACIEFAAAGLPIVTVYPSTAYGLAKRRGESPLTDMAHAFLRLPVLPLVGGDQKRNLVYVDDVVNGIMLAIEHGRPGEGYILGGENASPREYLEILGELLDRPVRTLTVPVKALKAAGRALEWGATRIDGRPPFSAATVDLLTKEWQVTSAKAERELGYRWIPLRGGLRLMLEDEGLLG